MSLTGASSLDLGKRLLEASREGNVDDVTDLMATGAPLTSDWLGTSPLHLAAQCGHTETAQILLSAGISRNGTTKVEKTPLHLAAQHGNLEIVKLLVANGALINAADMLNMTPLHWACEGGYSEIVDVLLKAGAKIDIRSKFGLTARDIAARKGHSEIILMLLGDYSNIVIPPPGLEVNTLDVKKRARGRKFPMIAGSWAIGDQGKNEKSAKSPQGAKRRRSDGIGAEQGGENGSGTGISQENSLSSLVSAAALVRSKVESSSPLKGGQHVTATRDASVLDTLATLATASTQAHHNQPISSLLGSPGTIIVSSPSSVTNPSFMTIPGLQSQIAMSHPSAVNLLNHPQLTASVPANLVGNLQMASPFALNLVPGIGGQPRLQLGNQPINNLQQITLPINMHHPGSHGGAILTGGSTTGMQQNLPAGTTLSIVGGIPSTQAQYIHPLAAGAGTPGLAGHSVTLSPQAAGAQGSIPVNIPISLFSSMFNNAMVTTSDHQMSTAASTADGASSATAATPAQPSVTTIGTGNNQELPGLQYVQVPGTGNVQLIPNQAYLQSQLVSALRGAVAPTFGQVPVMQQQGVYSPGTLTFPLNPINLSSILPTALSISQLPIPSSQAHVTTAATAGSVVVNLPVAGTAASVGKANLPEQSSQQQKSTPSASKPDASAGNVIPVSVESDSCGPAPQIIPQLQQLYKQFFQAQEQQPKDASSVPSAEQQEEKAKADNEASPTEPLTVVDEKEPDADGKGDVENIKGDTDQDSTVTTVELPTADDTSNQEATVTVVEESSDDPVSLHSEDQTMVTISINEKEEHVDVKLIPDGATKVNDDPEEV